MISGILLAAGNSSRMGERNKLLLPYKGEFLFLKALNAMQNSDLDEIIVVLGHEHNAMIPHFKNDKIKLTINRNHLEGLTTSIVEGLKIVSPKSKAYLFCLADMPLLKKEDINTLLSRFAEIKSPNIILRPVNKGVPGNPSVFSNTYYEELINCSDKNGCKSVIEVNKTHLHQYETNNPAYFTDIDTPSDYNDLK